MKKRRWVFMIFALLPFIFAGGGGDYDDGCSCFDDAYEYDPDEEIVITRGELDERLRQNKKWAFYDGKRSVPACPENISLKRKAYENGKRDGVYLEQSRQSIKKRKKKSRVSPVLATVTVSKGMWVAKYVDQFRSRGATLNATFECNGYRKGTNPSLSVGQKLKICRVR